MEKTVKTVKAVGIVKWICFPLGYLMYFCTRGSFGEVAAVLLAIFATVIFWALMRNEQRNLIGHTIATQIKEAISEISNAENFIEIKKLKSGIIARVYLINAKDQVAVVHKAISAKMEKSVFKKYLWVMQLTDMPSK